MSDTYLVHYGVKGMKWGVRHDYRPTSIRAAIARRSNDKVDKGFQNWDKGASRRETAISLGKTANAAKVKYELNPTSDNKKAYKVANRDYKKAYGKNTLYRKGQVRSEVGHDLARKYMSSAKNVKKKLDTDPSNSLYKKQYRDLMNKHDIERAKARKAISVGQARSSRKASMKRAMTMTVKTAMAATAVSAAVSTLNKYGNVSISSDQLSKASKIIRTASRYMY